MNIIKFVSCLALVFFMLLFSNLALNIYQDKTTIWYMQIGTILQFIFFLMSASFFFLYTGILIGAGREGAVFLQLFKGDVIKILAIPTPGLKNDDLGMLIELQSGARRYLLVDLSKNQRKQIESNPSRAPFNVGYYYRYIGGGMIEPLQIGKNK